MRVENVIANIIYTDPEDFDLAAAQDVMEAAVEKMEQARLP
jgi:hypothetical protein